MRTYYRTAPRFRCPDCELVSLIAPLRTHMKAKHGITSGEIRVETDALHS